MKKALILISLIIFFTDCATKNKLEGKQEKPIDENTIECNIEEKSNEIKFVIKNIGLTEITVLNPFRLNIERYNNESWETLKILHCPCDAPCNAPKEVITLKPGESYTINWNKQESWCSNEKVSGIRPTINKSAPEGKYRLKIKMSTDSENYINIYKTFELKISNNINNNR